VSPVRYEVGLNVPEDGILHSHRCEDLKSHTLFNIFSANIHIRRTSPP
jgi:hypothetical protein